MSLNCIHRKIVQDASPRCGKNAMQSEAGHFGLAHCKTPFASEAIMSASFISSLEPRRLFSASIDIAPAINPGDITVFDGVRIDASQFPARPVTVQVTNNGPVVNLPMLINGVVTGTASSGPDTLDVSNRLGADPASNLPGIVF